MKKKITKKPLLLFALMLTLFSFRANAQCPNPTSVTLSTETVARECGTDGKVIVTFSPSGIGSNVTIQLWSGSVLSGAKSEPASPYEFVNLEPGDYEVKLICAEDNSQIIKTDSVTVGDNYVPITAADISVDDACNNFTPGGTIKINGVTGGTEPYQYSIIKNDNTAYNDNLSEYSDSDSKAVTEFGMYQVRIKDACGNYKTFPYDLQPSVPPVEYHWKATADCDDLTKATGNYWWMQNPDTESGTSFGEHPNGIKLEIRADNASGDVLATVELNGEDDTFEYTMSDSHKYYVTATNACGVETTYTIDNTNRENREFSVSAGTEGCGSAEEMYVYVPLPDYHFWAYPVTVTLKNENGDIVDTKVLPDAESYQKDNLPPGKYEVTIEDKCGESVTEQVENPQDAGEPEVSLYERLMWRCELGTLSQEGTIQALIKIAGYLPDRQNAQVKIISGPSNVGILGKLVSGRFWGWTNMLPGDYTVEYTSCGQTYTDTFTIPSNQLLKQNFTASATSLCGGTGTINSNYEYNGSSSVEFRLYKSGETTPLETNNTGNFSNLPSGDYVVKMIILACGDEYQVGADANLTITAAGEGAAVTSSVGSVCEDENGEPLTTGQAYLTISGVAPFKVSYSIEDEDNWTVIEDVQYNTVIPNLEANEKYDLKITDNCGDLVNASVTVSSIGTLSTSNTVNPCVNESYTLEIPFYSGATYQWKNPTGEIVSNTRTYQVANWNSSYDGTYVATISWGECVVRYVKVTVNSNLCGEPIDTKADLSVTKTDNKDMYRLNETCTYTIVVKNNSTTVTIPNAKVTDLVPVGIEADKVTYTAVASSGSSTAVTGEQTGAIDDLVTLQPEGTVTYTVKVLVSSPFSGDLKNTVNVTMPDGYTDTDPTNNEATDINKPMVIAYNDINQTPQGIAVSGDVLTNDEGVFSVISAKYYDGSGNAQDLPIGIVQSVFGKDKNGHWVEAGTMKLESDGTYTFTPNATFIGNVPFDYTGQNTPNYTDDATLSIKVIPTPDANDNNPPIAQNDTYTIEQGQTATVPVLANDLDPDGDDLTVTNVTAKGSGTSTVTLTNTPQDVYAEDGTTVIGKASVNNDGEIIFTPADDFIGDVPFNYTISDGNGGTDTAIATITVLPANTDNNVYANDDVNTGRKGEKLTGNVTENDFDPENDSFSVTMIDTDGDGKPDTTPANDLSIEQNGVEVGKLTIADDGSYTWKPNADFVGTVILPYEIKDEPNNGVSPVTDVATLYLTNLDEPQAKDDVTQTPQNVPVDGNVLTNDDGTGLTVTGATVGGESITPGVEKEIEGGKITLNSDGTYTFSPETDWTGKVPTITYTVKDKYGNETTATLDITVIPEVVEGENEAPIANNDVRVTQKGKAVDLNVLANDHDSDKDEITVTQIKLDTNGDGNLETVAVPAGGSVTKDVYDGSRKTGSITIHSDGTTTFGSANHKEDTAKIKITVMPDNGNSVYANDDYGVARNAAEDITLNALDNDLDPEGDQKKIVSVQLYNSNGDLETVPLTSAITDRPVYDKGGNPIGTISIDADGNLTFDGNTNFQGTLAIPYAIEDAKGAIDTATIYLTQLDNSDNPLPIELVSFDATLQGNSVELTWVSATEINNDFYSIYKSNDGQTWEFWKDVQGAGNSNEELSYTEMDNEPYQGKNYYKLSQTDFDGTTEELGVRQVELTVVNTELFAYPNPTSGELNVVGLSSDNEFVALVNPLGQVVSCGIQYNAFKHMITIDMNGLTNGVYILKTTKGNIQVIKR